ncbi:MAG: HRDC domain-containing protein, partial [Anaerolineae bacterium]|nr:HRDC domain-containing protein [Anaerolineae bacterium]
DTESNSLYVYREQVCLIQISTPDTDYLIDPLALADLSALGPLLADAQVLKVFHGAEYDLITLYRDFGFTVANLFDTMWASRILGWPAHGLADLLQAHFGVAVDKRYQRANWAVRPLPPDQLDYARLDTHYLLALHDLQAQELERTRRWPQAQHRFVKLSQTRWEIKGFDPDGFWNLPGAHGLDDAGRGVLRALYLLRDRQAQAENRPPFKVLSNRALLILSEQRPQTIEALHKLRGVSSPLVRRQSHALLKAIRRGASQPINWDQRPRPANNNHNGRPTAECQARYEALRAWRNTAAQARGVEPDIVLTNQTLWAVAQRRPRSRADLTDGGLLAPWQVDEFGEEVLAVLKRMK